MLDCFSLVGQWIVVFEDHFNGNTLNTAYWYNKRKWGDFPPNVEPVIYLTENVFLQNGYLHLILKNDNRWHYVPNLNTIHFYPYSGGMIWSKKYFRYGIFEAKIKLPNEKKLWSAFWLYGSATYGDEIDIFEQYWTNKKVNLKSTIHHSGEQISDNNKYNTSFLDNWHTYTLSWDDKNLNNACIKVHIDGNKVSDFKKNNNDRLYNTYLGNIVGETVDYPEKGQNIIFNLFLHDNTPSLPQTMLVDYIKVWQKQNCNDIVTICNYDAKFDNNIFTGRIIKSGDNCNVIVNENEHLDLLATKEIHLKPGFSVKKGGYFLGKIIPCSSYKLDEENVYIDTTDENINIDTNIIKFKEIYNNYVGYRIFPNPFSEHLNISLKQIENSYFVIYDILGNIKHYEKFYNNNQEINLINLENGVYLSKLFINQKSYYEKVIKI